LDEINLSHALASVLFVHNNWFLDLSNHFLDLCHSSKLDLSNWNFNFPFNLSQLCLVDWLFYNSVNLDNRNLSNRLLNSLLDNLDHPYWLLDDFFNLDNLGYGLCYDSVHCHRLELSLVNNSIDLTLNGLDLLIDNRLLNNLLHFFVGSDHPIYWHLDLLKLCPDHWYLDLLHDGDNFSDGLLYNSVNRNDLDCLFDDWNLDFVDNCLDLHVGDRLLDNLLLKNKFCLCLVNKFLNLDRLD
jgi:hypothetical protein